jgi:hypothetical protein
MAAAPDTISEATTIPKTFAGRSITATVADDAPPNIPLPNPMPNIQTVRIATVKGRSAASNCNADIAMEPMTMSDLADVRDRNKYAPMFPTRAPNIFAERTRLAAPKLKWMSFVRLPNNTGCRDTITK